MQITKLNAYWQIGRFPAQFSNEIYVSERTALSFSYRSVFSLKYVAKGEEIYQVGGQEVFIPTNGYLLVNDGQDVTTLPHPGSEQAMSVFLEPGILADVFRVLGNKAESLCDDPLFQVGSPCFFERVYRQCDGSLGLYLGQLHQRMTRQDPDAGQIDLNLFFEIAEQVIQSQLGVFTQIKRLKSLKKNTREELYRRVLTGRDFLMDNVDRQVSLHEVSRQACLSPYHFHRIFQQVFGRSPLHFLKAMKMDRARQMLRAGKVSVGDIALALGYSDLFSFSKDFKKWEGFSPRKYAMLNSPSPSPPDTPPHAVAAGAPTPPTSAGRG